MCYINDVLKELMTYKCNGVKNGRCSKKGICDGGCTLFLEALQKLKNNNKIK